MFKKEGIFNKVHLDVPLEVEAKTGITGAMSSADLQVAAWPSCQRQAQFFDNP